MNKHIKLALLSTMLLTGASSVCNNESAAGTPATGTLVPDTSAKPEAASLREAAIAKLRPLVKPVGLAAAAVLVGYMLVRVYKAYNAEEVEKLAV